VAGNLASVDSKNAPFLLRCGRLLEGGPARAVIGVLAGDMNLSASNGLQESVYGMQESGDDMQALRPVSFRSTSDTDKLLWPKPSWDWASRGGFDAVAPDWFEIDCCLPLPWRRPGQIASAYALGQLDKRHSQLLVNLRQGQLLAEKVTHMCRQIGASSKM